MQTSRLFACGFVAALFLLPALSPAQTISMVAGNGQLVCQLCSHGPYNFTPLLVQVNDSTGKALPNTPVTWTPAQPGLTTGPSITMTNASGQASYVFTGLGFFFGSNFLGATVAASLAPPSTASVTFVETSVLPANTGVPIAMAALVPRTEVVIPTLSGAVGSMAAPITVTVTAPGPVPGISVALHGETTNGPSVSCAPTSSPQLGAEPGVILTDSTGTAVCTPVFGGAIGKGTYTLIVGGAFLTYAPQNLTVLSGPPAAIKYISGNGQSVTPGTTAPFLLQAEVEDAGGNASSGAAVSWTVSPAGAATLSSIVTTSPTSGLVTAKVTPVAPAQVTVALVGKTGVQYTFSVGVNVIVTGLQYSAGNAQSAAQGAAFTSPLVVQVNDNGAPVNDATVNFAVTSGSATLSATSAASNSQGFAQVTATAGPTAGPVTVVASIVSAGKTYSYSFNLTVVPPGPVISSVVNSVGQSPLVASPCSLVTIYGTGLADGIQGVVSPPVVPLTKVAGVTVQFGGVFAPILYVANTGGQESVSVQVPCETSLGAAVPMAVSVNGVSSTYNVDVTQYSPGIFQFTDYDGQMRGILIGAADGILVTVGNTATGVSPNPARPGSTYRMFVTGLGQTNPPLVTNEFDPLTTDSNGDLVPQDLAVTASLLVGVNLGGATIVSAHYAFGMVGVYEVDFVMPENTAAGTEAPFQLVAYQDFAQLSWANLAFIDVQ